MTSNGNTNIDIKSSNEEVAKIEYRYNKCYVKYLKAGTATITTTMGSVFDSFNVEVFEKIPSGFRVYDFAYYGENYATRPSYINNIVCYSDDREALSYEYGYELFDEAGNIDNDYFNNGLLEIDESSFNGDYFDDIYLDTANKKLKINCKQQLLSQSVHTSIAIKSYLMVDGEKCLDDIFTIDVYIIANEIEFIQIELSTNPDFTNKSIYLNIKNVKYTNDLTNEDLISYLTCHRVEEKLGLAGENAVYELFITNKTPEIYMKFRLVYTNGTLYDLNMSNLGEVYKFSVDGKEMNSNSSKLTLSLDNENYLEADPLGEYFVLKVNSNYMTELANDTLNINFSLLGDFIDLNLNADASLKSFKFVYLDMNNVDDVKKLYIENEDGSYSYSYWDKRTESDDVVYDENGNVTEFLG